MRRGRVDQEQEVRLTRWMLVTVGLLCVVLAVVLHGWSVIFFASFAAAVAASTILPALLCALKAGAVANTCCGGAVSSPHRYSTLPAPERDDPSPPDDSGESHAPG